MTKILDKNIVAPGGPQAPEGTLLYFETYYF